MTTQVGEWLRRCLRRWWRRRQLLRKATFEADLSTTLAKRRLAGYRAKAEIEWDIRWADKLDKTWRDEMFIVLWSIPLVGMFVPGIQEPIKEGFKFLATLDPDAPKAFLYGWVVIFAATFGIRQGTRFLWPGRLAGLVEALGRAPDDVPDDAARAATDAVSPDDDK